MKIQNLKFLNLLFKFNFFNDYYFKIVFKYFLK